ncbi:MAG: roadblock/LC7 domain-containing protein [Gemmatimonadota bacterium]
MIDDFNALVDRVTAVQGVRGALVVSEEDGFVVAATLMEGLEGEAAAALAAALMNRITTAFSAAGRRRPTLVHCEATQGGLLATPLEDGLLLVAVLEPGANVGLARLALLEPAGGTA